MSSVLPAPQLPSVFSSRSGLGFSAPPSPPPRKPRLGSYCFKATCDIYDKAAHETAGGHPVMGCPVRGRVVGYDTDPSVGKDAEAVCRSQVNLLGNGRYACGEASVVMLHNSVNNMECSGQFFFTFDNETKKLFG